MTKKHSIITLKANSPQVVQKQKCPVRKTHLQSGDEVVLCHERGVAVTLEGWREMEAAWEGRCPYCEKKVTLTEAIAPLPPQPKPPLPPYKPPEPPPERRIRLSAGVITALVIVLLCSGLILGITVVGLINDGGGSTPVVTRPTPTPTPISPSPPSSTFTPTPISPSPPSATFTATPLPTLSSAEIEQQIQQVIWDFQSVKSEAVGPGCNDSRLSTVLRERALEEQQGSVRWLCTCKAYYETTLHHMWFESIKLLSPTYATVVVKKEESRTYHQEGKRSKSWSRDIYRVSYDLKKIEGRWYIVRKGVIDEQTGFTPTPGPIPSGEINCG